MGNILLVYLLGVPVPATVDGFAVIWKGSGEVLEDSFQSIPDKSKMVRGERCEVRGER